MSLADPPDTTFAHEASPPTLVWTTPRSAASLVANAILEAVAEAFPKARQRRRFAGVIAEAVRDLDAQASRRRDCDTADRVRVRVEGAAALHGALDAHVAALARFPAAQLACVGPVRPLRAPLTGAEAVLAMSTPQEARKRLRRALDALSGLHERTLSLAHDLTDALDRIEGDPDIEPGCDDDANVASYVGAYDDRGWSPYAEGRLVDDAEDDDADGEPELGSQEGGHGGTQWNRPGYWIAGEEEASLGWSDNPDQRGLHDSPDDREWECEDEGAQQDAEPDDAQASCVSLMQDGRVIWPPPGTMLKGEW